MKTSATTLSAEPQLDATELRLPRAPGVLRRWLTAHPRAVDWVIVAGYLFGCALMLTFDTLARAFAPVMIVDDAAALEQLHTRFSYLQWPWVVVTGVVIGVTALALRFRRRAPIAGVVVITVLLVFEQGLLAVPGSIALAFMVFAVPLYRSVAAGWVALAIAAAVSGLVIFFSAGANTGVIGPAGIMIAEGPFDIADRLIVVSLNTLWLLLILMVGINLGNRRRYVAALIDRVHQLAREREQRAQLAVAAERSRIAREMHDVVAHSVSVMVTLSEGAGAAVGSQPEAARQAMLRSAETGRQALIEMRRLLGVLGDETSPERPFTPQPGVAQLPELIASFADAGLRVTVTEQGTGRGDATQQLAVYRIVQEALTNVLRHAGPAAAVEVRLISGAERTRIEVIDDGGGGSPSVQHRAIPGSGKGLAGAAERARLFGGYLEFGPRTDGRTGWRLCAEVPTGGSLIPGDEAVARDSVAGQTAPETRPASATRSTAVNREET